MKFKSIFLFYILFSLSSYGTVVVNGIYYNLNGTKASVAAGFPRYSGNVIIPSSFSYAGTIYNVTSIESVAFEESIDLTSITIPNSIIQIGAGAFRNCSALETIKIPSSVTLIDNYAFQDCIKLKSITLEDGIEVLVFSNNSYSKDIFKNCPIETLYLGRNITFSYTSGSPFYSKTTLRNLTIGNKVTNIFYMSFDGCSGLTGKLIIPNSVTSIGSASFRGCSNLSDTLSLPSKIKTIGSFSFENCSKLVALILPDSVSIIGNSAFRKCSNLTGVLHLPKFLTKIDQYAFDGCSKLSGILSIPVGTITIEQYAFNDCIGFTGLILSNTIKTIANYAFSNCKSVGGTLTIPNSVTSIGERAFQVSGARKINTGHGISSVSAFAFNACPNLQSLVIGNSVTIINEYAFSNCTLLDTVAIGKKVLQINSKAFVNCRYITEINCKSSQPPSITSILGIEDINQSICTLNVGWQSTSLYKNHTYWKGFFKILEKDFALESDASLSNLTIETGVLNPLFQPNIYNYTATVTNDIEFVIIHRLSTSPTATILMSEGAKYLLNVGENIIPIIVNSEDGNICTYTLKIYRQTSTNSIYENSIYDISIYPIPTKDYLIIRSAMKIDKVEIYSLTGSMLFFENKINEKIAISFLPNGIYLLNVYTNNKLFVRKILKD